MRLCIETLLIDVNCKLTSLSIVTKALSLPSPPTRLHKVFELIIVNIRIGIVELGPQISKGRADSFINIQTQTHKHAQHATVYQHGAGRYRANTPPRLPSKTCNTTVNMFLRGSILT